MSKKIRLPSLRKYWKPALATSAGGTSVILWFEEIMMHAEEFIGVLFLPILAGAIYIFDILLFRSTKPGEEDKKEKHNAANTSGTNKPTVFIISSSQKSRINVARKDISELI